MRRTLIILVYLLVGTFLTAQPANDDCSGATSISSGNLDDGSGNCNTLSNQSIVNASEWTIPPGVTFTGNCWNGADSLNVVFYEFTAQGVSGSVEVINGPGDYYVSVIEFTGASCDGQNITEWGCGDNAPVNFDNVLTLGTTYYVIVAFAQNVSGSFDLCVFNPVAALNDECIDAVDLPNLSGSPCNTGMNNYYPSTDAFTATCFPADATHTVWYSFTAQGVSIADLHIDGATDDAHIAVWDFNGSGLCDLSNGTVLHCQSSVTTADPVMLDNGLVPGNTYYIQLAFDNNMTGTFDVCLDAPVPAFNDDCTQAVVYPSAELSNSNCLGNIGGQNLNSNWPSSDVIAPACWDDDYTQNLWFQFVAQGPDVDVSVGPGFGANPQIALVAFAGGNSCDPGSAVVLACSSGSDLNYYNALTPNATYYVMVGFDSDQTGDYCIDIYNPIPPDNDHQCNALQLPTDGSCNGGVPCSNDCYTTEFANPEFDPGIFPPECQGAFENTVWFTVQLSDPSNVGLEINVQEVTGVDFSVAVGTFDVCTGTFFVEDLECGGDFPFEFGPVTDPDQEYYVMVGSSIANAGAFNICVNEVVPCFDNNDCDGPSDAEPIPGVISDGGFACVTGCNLWASPNTLDLCDQNTSPTVWYLVQTDGAATTMNINVTSTDISAPTIGVFEGVCGNLLPLPVNGGDHCATGTLGSAIASLDVNPGQQYYISVSGINTGGGDFEICVNTIGATTPCVMSTSQEVTYRSFGGDLDGPFLPGEQVTVCFTIHEYMPPANECQWLQGVVPVFGNGWQILPFTLQGAQVNGNMIPAPGVYGGMWEVFTDVQYNNNVPWLSVGDFDGNWAIDICNSNYDPDCPGFGITGGMVQGACNDGGTVLPPGWFCHNKVDGCTASGHPDDDWGDGDGCFGVMGPWEFCVDLLVRDYPACATTDNTSNLTLSFHTFTHGEIGAWQGTSSVCASDPPNTKVYSMCCVEDESLTENYPPFCTPGVFSYTPDHPGIDYWEWVVNPPPSVTGPIPGSGPAGTTVINTIANDGLTTEIVEYTFQGYAGGNCPAVIKKMLVVVYPELVVDMVPFNACATPNTPYELVPSVAGGEGMGYNFEWFDGSSSEVLLISDPDPGQLYSLTVTDQVGCTSTAAVTLNVYETFPVDIEAPLLEQCFSDGPIDLTATAEDGTPGYSYEWTSPMGNLAGGPQQPAEESGQWNVLVTDSQGCIGEDSISLNFYDSPVVNIVPDIAEICPFNPNPEQIIATATGGLPPYQFAWTMPNGTSANSFIFADVVGEYSILVTDFNGCTTEIAIDVGEADYPLFDLGGTVTLCEEDLLVGYDVSVPMDPSYNSYQWSNGELSSSINVTEPGPYTVTVTNTGGCLGTGEVVIDTYDPIPDVFAFDTATFCEGGFAEIEGPFDYTYEWSTGGTSNPLFVVASQSIVVTVTDENGCTTEDVFDVVESTSLLPNIQGDSVVCNGVAIDLICANFPLVDWYDDPALSVPIVSGTNMISINSTGWYFVVVSDGNGCFGIDSVQVTAGTPVVSISGDAAICSGESTILDVGTWSTISWSTGETGEQITSDTAGSFSVTVTDDNGCSATAAVDVVNAMAPVASINGSSSFCTGSSTLLDAGAPFTTYTWSTGESAQMITVTNPGMIYLTVTNAEGCDDVDSLLISESTELSPIILGDTVVCNNTAVALDAGSGFASYSWSTGESSQQISVSAPGVVGVTVTDNSGCTGTDVITVEQGEASVSISGDLNVCDGEMSQLDATPGFAEYLWSTTETTPSISVSSAGNYSVTVTDVVGCTGEMMVVVDINPDPQVEITGSSTFCTGGSTVLDAGSGFTSYDWSTSENSQTISITQSGTISVTVTDVNGCTATDEMAVTEGTSLTPVINGDSLICNNATATLNAGSGYATYNWSNGPATQTIQVMDAAIYVVTVSDNSGCTGTAEFQVEEGSADVAISGDNQLCEGEQSLISATSGFEQYSWSTTELTESIIVTTTGDYTVTVTDVSGCTGTAVYSVQVDAAPNPQIAGSVSFCTGGSTTLDAGAGYSSYDWSTGESTQTVVVDQASSVTVTVTDANGCSGTDVVNVTEATELILNVSDTSVCEGGMVTLIVGAFDSYFWSTTEVTPTIDVVTGGTYGVTVSDVTGCTGTATIQVDEVEPPFAGVLDSAVCNTTSGGSVLNFPGLITSGDATGLWKDLDNSGATGTFPVLDFDGVIAGTYRFEYTTQSAVLPCLDQSYTISILVRDCACPSPMIGDPDPVCNDIAVYDLTQLTINGVTEPGGIWVLVSTPGGSNPAQLSGASLDVAGRDPGLYEIAYRLTNVPVGCPDNDMTTLDIVEAPDAGSPLPPAQVCVGDDSTLVLNEMIVNADPGGQWTEISIPLSIAGFNAQAGTFNTELELPGTYVFQYTASTAAPCSEDVTTIEVVVEDVPVADAGSDQSITCDNPFVMIGSTGSSQGGSIEYLWSTTDGIVIDPTLLQPTIRDAGTYTLAVTNTQTGCVSYDEVLVDVVGNIPTALDFTLSTPDCKEDPPASLSVVSVNGGIEPYTFDIDGGTPQSEGVFEDLAPGEHILTVRDDVGCVYESVIVIPVPDYLEGTLAGDLTISRGEQAVVYHTLSSGFAVATLWTDSEGNVLCADCDTLRFEPTESIELIVTVTDSNGCVLELFTSVNVVVNRDLFVPNVFSPNGDGVNDRVTVFGEKQLELTYFRIFTRWGELVYEVKNVPAGDLSYGWDGSNNGEALEPGVYVYSVEVAYLDGSRSAEGGDITLIR